MSLRVKVEVVLFVVVGLVIALSFSIQKYAILPGLNPLEEKVAKKDMERCIEALEIHASSIDRLCAEWAGKPTLQSAARDNNRDALSDELDVEQLLRERLNFVSVLDSSGRVLWQKTIDLEQQTPITFEEFPEDQWPDTTKLWAYGKKNVSGLYVTSKGPMLVSSRPILGNDEFSSAVGRLVLGRMVDRLFLARLYSETSVSFQLWSISDYPLPEEEAAALKEILRGNLTYVNHVSKDLFRVYETFPDIDGKAALLLRSDIHRNVLKKAYNALERGLLAQVGIGLAALLLLIILFRHSVMNPLTRLTNHTTEIGRTNDLSARIEMDRSDEIGTLAYEFDRMVEQLDAEMAKQKSSEEALRESEERYALAVRGANDGLWDWSLGSDEIHFSARWKAMVGYEEHELEDTKEEWFKLIHPDDVENVQAAIEAHIQAQTAHLECEYRIRHKGNNYLWVLCRGLAVRDDDGRATRMAGSQADITLRKLVEEQLSHQALHDSLTTLPNRALFLDRLGQALKQSRRNEKHKFAVLFLDLDRFKVVNDGLGHAIGDLLLSAIAERLSKSLRDGDSIAQSTGTVARFGGDEFVLLLDNIRDVSEATAVADRVQAVLKDPFVVDGNEIFTTASIGIAISAPEYETAEELVRNADTAMYRAKAEGTAKFAIFDSDMHSKAIARLKLENDLRRAIERDEFVAYYQPILNLETGKLEAFEALIRWMHPDRGTLSPVEFIPVAEETGMIVPIGEQMMRKACRQTRAWQIKHSEMKDLCVSVNLSAKEFSQPDIVRLVKTIVTESGLDPKYLRLEITESAIMESLDFITRSLRMLREMEIELSIDDFGTGYSSLSYLHRFPMNTLKIDQAFVREMNSSRENMQIVKTIVMLARALEMTVVAEGIESDEQMNSLRDLGCESGQGFLFSPPMDALAAEAYFMQKAGIPNDSLEPV